MKCKVKLVDNTMGASYVDREISFNPKDLIWSQEVTNRKAFSDKAFPDITEFCFKGSDLVFRARSKDFFEALEKIKAQ
jgi:hypothetical protein